MAVNIESNIKQWGEVLNDGNKPLVDRYQALKSLKHTKNNLAVDMIAECFKSKSDLLRHDLAYCLGQMGNEMAIKILHNILDNEKEAPIVRHEAGEALAAIGHTSSLDILRKYSKDKNKELAETCYLGCKRMEWVQKQKSDVPSNRFHSIDPAPEYGIHEKSIEELSEILLNPKVDIFEKYRSLFTLRRIADSKEKDAQVALNVINKALKCPSSALFRHQVAFVIGQLGKPESLPVLKETLGNLQDLGMVRHESADALGKISNDESKNVLHKFLEDKEQVVKETCVVALGIKDYNSSEHI